MVLEHHQIDGLMASITASLKSLTFLSSDFSIYSVALLIGFVA
ncbi:hypothetical protein [Vibrio splendidus]|nr:hypothetical protein [Vibrio splendidus]